MENPQSSQIPNQSSQVPESCRKPDKVFKLKKTHPMFQNECTLPDTLENRQNVKTVIHCCFDKTKEDRIKWVDSDQIDATTGDIKGMDLHHKAKARGFANPLEMYEADKKAKEDVASATITAQATQITALQTQISQLATQFQAYITAVHGST